MPARPQESELYNSFIADMVGGEIRPGQRLGEESLAARWKVGRGPVREALFRLEQDGLVTRKPKSGTFVRAIDADELGELYDLRIAIESLVAARLSQRVTAAQLTELTQLARKIDLHRDKGGADERKLHHGFHLKLSQYSGMKHAARMLRVNRLLLLCGELTFQVALVRGEIPSRRHEPDHRAIVAAIRSRDSSRAAAVMHAHLENKKQQVCRDIELYQAHLAALRQGAAAAL